MTNSITYSGLNRKICLAPMMDYTDRHFRYLMRLISKRMLLYTEMVHCGAILFGDRDRFLAFDSIEEPVSIQLGGNDPKQLAECAKIAEDYGYSEVNLNVGCPSDRVQSGQFGACLMANPQLVAECVAAMQAIVSIPVTVKNRIGIDKHTDYDFLYQFVTPIAQAGCTTFIVHARKAWLQGLSPKQNREIPPLEYEKVYRLKQDFPGLNIIINGGITDYEQIDVHLQHVDGVMIGRKAYDDPYYWRDIDHRYFGIPRTDISREIFVKQYADYIQSQLSNDVYLKHMARHILNMFAGQPGAKVWRRFLSENINNRSSGIEIIEQAMDLQLKQCA